MHSEERWKGPADQSLQTLRRVSAIIGADISLIQGAGGNVSLKSGGLMWIKASGTWLADAEAKDIMVPVVLGTGPDDPPVVSDQDRSGLRPSIETSMHAVLPQRVVLHVHAVDVLALAVRTDGPLLLKKSLAGLRWAMVPYARPGAPLTQAILDSVAGAAETLDLLVLANHGLVVMADDVLSAHALLNEVVARVAVPPLDRPDAATGPHTMIDGHGFHAATDPFTHILARDPVGLAVAEAGPLYPDHVVFLGPEPLVIDADVDLGDALHQFRESRGWTPKWLVVRGVGVAVADDLPRGGAQMLRCLADVAARIPADAPLQVLSDADIAALTGWDAEQYRQQMAGAGAADRNNQAGGARRHP